MSIPKKEFLSKKKCMYATTFFPDGTMSIERRAIVYLNTVYAYAKVPGSDDLIQVTLRNIHDTDDIELIASNFFLALRYDHEVFRYYWERPKITEDRIKEVRKRYLLDQITNYRKKIDDAKEYCEKQVETYEAAIITCKTKLDELEKK